MDLQHDEPLGDPAPPPARRTRRRLAGALGITLIGLTLGVSAAAATSPSPEPAPAGAGTLTVVGTATGMSAADEEKLDAAFTEFRACMREHGIDMPEPVLVEAGGPGTAGQTIVGTGTLQGAVPVEAPDAGAFEAADAACAPILEAAGITQMSASAVGSARGQLGVGPTGAGLGGGVAVVDGGVASAEDVAAMVAPIREYAACMREHGMDVPDPVVDEKAGTFEMRLDVDPPAAEFRAADAACADGSGFGFAVPVVPAAPAGP